LRTEPRRCDRHAPIAPWVPSIHLGFRFPARRPQGRRFGEKLLLDALRRAVDAASIIGRTGVIVDAMDEEAERFLCPVRFRHGERRGLAATDVPADRHSARGV
jgi:hypothetical protein